MLHFCTETEFLHFFGGCTVPFPAWMFLEESGQGEVYEFADSYGSHSCDLVDPYNLVLVDGWGRFDHDIYGFILGPMILGIILALL